MKILNILSLLLILLPASLAAQQVLPLEQAVATALKTNYNIQIARKNAAIAANNNTLGNAGFLPIVTATAVQNNSITNTRQEFFNGTINERDGARSQSFNGQVLGQWVIFDGLAMFTSRQTLMEMERIGYQQMQLDIETTLMTLQGQYYQLAAQYQRLDMLKEAIAISAERMRFAENKRQVGSGSLLDELTARVDLNADSAAYLQALNDYRTSCAQLSAILGTDPGTEWLPSDTSLSLGDLVYADLLSEYQKQNRNLQQARSQYRLSELNRRFINNTRLPIIMLNGGYSYVQSQAQVGQLLSNRSFGPSYGFTANVTLFDGFNTNRRYQEARIREEIAGIQEKNIDLQLRTNLLNSFNSYVNSKSLLNLELRNLDAARSNVDIAMEKYKLGLISNIELRDVQRSYIQVQERLLTSWQGAQQAKINIDQLTGKLIK